MDCGCTVFPWEYRCRSCQNKVAEDVTKEKEQNAQEVKKQKTVPPIIYVRQDR